MATQAAGGKTKSTITLLMIRIVGVVLGYAGTIAMTRTMPQGGFGQLSIAMTIVSLIAMLALCGVDQTSTRFVAEYLRSRNTAALGAFLLWSRRIVFVAAIAATIIAMLIFWLGWSEWMSSSGLMILLPGVILVNYTAMIRGQLIGSGNAIFGQFAEQIVRPMIVLCGIAAIWFLETDLLSAVMIASVLLLSQLGAAIVQKIVQGRPLSVSTRSASIDQNMWIKVSLPLMLTTGIFLLMNRTDLLLVGALLGDRDAAAYSVAIRVATLVGIPLIATQQVFNRQIVRSATTADESNRIATSSQRISIIAGILSLALFLPMCVLMKPILNVFGHEYVEAYPLVLILGGTYVVAAWLGPTGKILGLNDGHRILALLVLMAAIANLAIGLVLVPLHGAIGAAIATSVSTLIWKVSAIFVIRRRLGFLMPFSNSVSFQKDR